MVLSKIDEKLAEEAISKATFIKEDIDLKNNVSEMTDDICKRRVYFELTQSKQQIIRDLTKYDYQTSPIKIAESLNVLFKEWKSEQGWWLYVAQKWNPRAINRTIIRLIKLHLSGKASIVNPAAYFTYLIRYRKKRRSL